MSRHLDVLILCDDRERGSAIDSLQALCKASFCEDGFDILNGTGAPAEVMTTPLWGGRFKDLKLDELVEMIRAGRWEYPGRVQLLAKTDDSGTWRFESLGTSHARGMIIGNRY